MGKEEALMLLAKARECLNEAQALYNLEFYSGSINRSYYSIFNAIQSVLQSKDILVKTHQGAHVQLHQSFIKTGILPDSIKKIPQQVENLRLKADYEPDTQLYKGDAKTALDMSTEFYTAIKQYFDAIS